MNILSKLKSTADYIAAGMLASMSIVFIVQIAARYLSAAIGVSLELGWTLEFLLTTWVWLVFWATAFCVPTTEHIRFDSVYVALPTRFKRLVSLCIAVALVVILAYSFLPTWDYILFLKIKKSPVMRIPMNYVFSIYGVLLGALILRYAFIITTLVVPSFYQRYHAKKL